MNNTCGNCKYWDNQYGHGGEENGNCSRLGMNDLIISDALSFKYISFHKNGNPQAVLTGKNFGCINFEQNNKQQ